MAKKKRRKIISSTREDGITVAKTDERRVFIVSFFVDMGGGRRFQFKRKSPFQTVGQSREWGRQHRAHYLAGGPPRREAPRADPDAPRPFAFWAKRYLEDAQSPAKRGGPNRSSTVRGKVTLINRHLVPAFGPTLVTQIDDDMVERYLIDKTREGLARGTLRNHTMGLRGVLRLAKRKGCEAERAMTIPTAGAAKDKGERLPSTLSEPQTDTLMAELEANAEAWQFAVVTLLFRAGLRIGEALALRWSDIDFDRETIKVQRSANDDGVSEFTKGGKVRTVPIHWQVSDALARLDTGPDGWVFPSPRPRSVAPRGYKSAMRGIRPYWDACSFVGDNGKPIRWHTHIGRHSLGRHWAERGFPIKGLQELLGHADIATTMVYMHWSSHVSGPMIQTLGGRRLRLAK